MDDNPANKNEGARDAAWQRRLLPLMSGLLVVAAAYFLWVSAQQLYAFTDRMRAGTDEVGLRKLDALQKDPMVAPLLKAASSEQRLTFAKLKLMGQLESGIVYRRYHQANNLLVARTWNRYLGFLTGMILALVGAAFILGKLREEASVVDVEAGVLKGKLQSASPGVMLAGFGTALMMTTLLAHHDIEVSDKATYLAPALLDASPGMPDPGEFPRGTGSGGPAAKGTDAAGERDPMETLLKELKATEPQRAGTAADVEAGQTP